MKDFFSGMAWENLTKVKSAAPGPGVSHLFKGSGLPVVVDMLAAGVTDALQVTKCSAASIHVAVKIILSIAGLQRSPAAKLRLLVTRLQASKTGQ